MRVAKLYPVDGGARWGAPWYDASGRRRAVTAATVEEAVAKRAKRMAGWTSDEKLGDFLAWWTREYLPRRVANGRLAEETMDGYESSVRLHITPHIGAVNLTDLTATVLEDWLDELDDDGLGARGRQKALRTLSVALSVAVKRDLIGRNPARGVEGPRVVAKRVTPWTRAQAGRSSPSRLRCHSCMATCGSSSSAPVCGRQRRSHCTSTMSTCPVLGFGCTAT